MEQTAAPPSQPPLSAVITATTITTSTHPDSVDSSPRSRTTESWLEDTAAAVTVPSTAVTAARGGVNKLRLMCSYGGHIVPRPHDKSLCYVGGDTRIVTVDRNTTVAKLVNRLSKTLIRSNSLSTVTVTATATATAMTAFTVKYQLPNEDLDSLISVTTDEDLENLIDEYDRLNLSNSNSRIRLFLFPNKPESVSESVSSIGSLLESATKSEDWFVNALNGTTSSGFSDTSSFNCLLGLDDEIVVPKKKDVICKNVLRNNSIQDVQSVPDSPIMETSSFGSASSLGNLPPVRVDDQHKGIEEQFAQISVQDGNLVPVSVLPLEPVPVVITGVPIGSKVVQPQQQQQQQYQQKHSVGFDMVSPDSVSSDGSGSVTNPLSRRKPPVIYTDPIAQTPFTTTTNNNSNRAVETSNINVYDQTTRIPIQQPPQVDSHSQHAQVHHQPQFIHTAIPQQQYIHHHPSGAIPMTSYYQMYPPQTQHHAAHTPLDQHNFVYYMPARQQSPPPQSYTLPLQADSSPAVSGPPTSQVPPPTSLFTTPRTVQNATKVEQPYRTANSGASGPQLVQVPVPSSQHQLPPQYVGYSVAPGVGGNYGYADSSQQGQHIYYAAQPLPPQSAAQFQTMASTLPVEAQTGSHIQTDNNMKQQVRTSQP